MFRLITAICAAGCALILAAVPAAMAVAPAAGGVAHFRHDGYVLLPDPRVTPGAVSTDDTARLCAHAWPDDAGEVSDALRRKVFHRYGLAYPQPTGLFQIDALIPLSLGGAPTIANLWPQPTTSGGWRLKDNVERKLHSLVCQRRLGIAAARQAVRSPADAYATYLAPPMRGCCVASYIGVGFTEVSDPVRAGTVAQAVGQGTVFPDHTQLPILTTRVTYVHPRIPTFRWTVPTGHGAGVARATLDCATKTSDGHLYAQRTFTLAR
jgi:hypothetical protein